MHSGISYRLVQYIIEIYSKTREDIDYLLCVNPLVDVQIAYNKMRGPNKTNNIYACRDFEDEKHIFSFKAGEIAANMKYIMKKWLVILGYQMAENSLIPVIISCSTQPSA